MNKDQRKQLNELFVTEQELKVTDKLVKVVEEEAKGERKK